MNPIIKKLAQESGIAVYAPEGLGGGGYLDNEEEINKFAKALILECCKMVNNHVQWNNPHDCLLVLDIKDRFDLNDF